MFNRLRFRTFFALLALLTVAQGFTTPAAFAVESAKKTTPLVLITDVDDTIKVSQILDPVGKVIRFLSDPVAFAGMPNLYRQLMDHAKADGRDHGFAVVSGTPWIIGWSLWDFLEDFGFPESSIVAMRPLATETLDFKSDEISKIIDQDAVNGGHLILVGDDTEVDHEAYSAAKEWVADKRDMTTEIFIRRVSGRAKNQGSTYAFDSAADIAVVEFLGGRLSAAEVETVFSEIESEQDLEQLFVPGEYCPSSSDSRLSDDPRVAKAPQAMLKRLKEVENHLRRACADTSGWFRLNRGSFR